MTRFSSRTLVTLAIAGFAAAIASAEPTSGPPIQVYGGQNGGKTRMLDDAELTAITKVELAYQKQVSDLANARSALAQASWTGKSNSADLIAKVSAVANAELALATKRADAFQQVKTTLKNISSQKLAAVVREMGGPMLVAAAPAAGSRGAAGP